MTDSDIQDLIADNQGYTSNNPFRKLSYPEDDDPLDFDRDYIDEDPDEDDEEDNSPDMLSDGDDVDYTYDPNF